MSEQHGLSTTHTLSRHLEQAAQVGNTSRAREGARRGCEVVAGGKSQLSSPPASTGSQPRPWASLYPAAPRPSCDCRGTHKPKAGLIAPRNHLCASARGQR